MALTRTPDRQQPMELFVRETLLGAASFLRPPSRAGYAGPLPFPSHAAFDNTFNSLKQTRLSE